MDWKGVGSWLKENAGTGAALAGQLLLGNYPGAVAAGVALVSSATGTSDPASCLQQLQTDPQSIIRLKELTIQEDQNIRMHLQEMTRIELEDKQKSHNETQRTIRNADKLKGGIQWVRPTHATLSLVFALFYAFEPNPSFEILAALLALPVGYAGLREIGKFNQLKLGQTT